MKEYRTRGGGRVARLNGSPFPWDRTEFAWLGTITFDEGHVIGWAWHLDGRSIDRDDDGFDLIDFAQEKAA